MFHAERKPEDIRGTFFEKCYICETADIFGEEEHRIPKSANKSDENFLQESNVFWACSRCNHKKGHSYFEKSNKCKYGNGYLGIIDCTKCDPNQYIKMKISEDYKHEILITEKRYAPCVEFTVRLLNNIYCSKKKMDADISNLKSKIIIEVNKVNLAVDLLYNEVYGGQSKIKIQGFKTNIIEYLLPSAPYSAFKRTFLEETYEIVPNGTFKDILKEILDDPSLNPMCEVTTCSVIQ